MSKFGTFLVIVILFIGVGYIYYKNTQDIGTEIEKIKLKYAISENSPAENIYQFADTIKKLHVSNNLQQSKINFEYSFWYVIAYDREASDFISKQQSLFNVDCKSTKVIELKNKLPIAKKQLEVAKTTFTYVKNTYSANKQEYYSAILENLEKDLEINENLIYIACPK